MRQLCPFQGMISWKNTFVNKVLLSFSDESILNDDDEQFFDSHATNEGFDNDKEFKLLEECTRNGDGELRELIFHQMSEVSDFVPTMLLMGSKFQIDNFMILFEIVEEALRKQQGSGAQDKFKMCLELKLPDFLSRLVSYCLH